MNIYQAIFKTSIGKKVVMAVTGVILIGYIIGHLMGNLQLFADPEKINAYAHFLQGLGPTLWAIRIFMLIVLVLHIWVAVALVIENNRARPKNYAQKRFLRASYASRTMRYSGLIVLVFLVYHVLHFTVRSTHGEDFYPTVMIHGERVTDVHSMMILGFQQTGVALIYLIGVGLLAWHLRHGVASMFQSIGLRTRSWASFLEKLAVIFAVLYFLGNAAIVVAAYTGMVEIQNEELRAQLQVVQLAPCGDDCQTCESRTVN